MSSIADVILMKRYGMSRNGERPDVVLMHPLIHQRLIEEYFDEEHRDVRVDGDYIFGLRIIEQAELNPEDIRVEART